MEFQVLTHTPKDTAKKQIDIFFHGNEREIKHLKYEIRI